MRNHKKYSFVPRWKIVLKLVTASPLHVGSGEFTHSDALTVTEVQEGKSSTRQADINECIKNSKDKPFIPGSTVKGNIRQWLEEHLAPGSEQVGTLFRELFGYGMDDETNQTDQGRGGAAEFLAAKLTREVSFTRKENAPPWWDADQQTFVETSIAVNRPTRTVLDKKLFYSEAVPEGAGFTLIVVGAMTMDQAALLAATLEAGFSDRHRQPITLGGDTCNGSGRMKFERLRVFRMDKDAVKQWLEQGDDAMAENGMPELDRAEVDDLVKRGSQWLAGLTGQSTAITINLRFAGPFLVNDPSRGRDSSPDHFPLLDRNNNPVLPAKSLRGSLRSQAEKIVRTLGGFCCDPADPCSPVFSAEEAEKELCPVCLLFGNSGWKSRVDICAIEFQDNWLSEHDRHLQRQDFVAIDRFHGGGRDTAKFDADYFHRPAFTITLAAAPDIKDWARGLLALTLRDFQEGDITLGFGRAKGYGQVSIDETTIFGAESLGMDKNLDAFREKCAENSQPLRCVARENPEPVEFTPPSEKGGLEDSSGKFHNPYHFIPTPKPGAEKWLKKEDFGPEMHDSHALYRDKDDGDRQILHGRIECTLTSETPLFVGGERIEETTPQEVEHFQINGDPAIPATSLRGMLSSLAEAASNSSMRVLDDGMMSYRQKVGEESLSAMGMVIIRDGHYYLYPLALPLLYHNKAKPEFQAMFPPEQGKKAPMKVYLEKAYIAGTMKTFLNGADSWSFDNNTIYYLPVPEFRFDRNSKVSGNNNALKPGGNGNLILGIRLTGNPVPSTTKQSGTVPGILRILGKEGRKDIPGSKKHELFLPVPQAFADNPKGFLAALDTKKDLFAIADEVVNHFEKLADQRTRPQIKHPEGIGGVNWLPYQPKGCMRNTGLEGDDSHKLRVQHGDLVYFQPYLNSPRQVAEISFSAIWRSRVEKTVYDYFPDELLPFNKKRETISPAELLFGFVQQEKGKEQLAFAGKTIVSSAQLQDGQEEPLMKEAVPLKILSSPKLPSPPLYFKEQTTGKYISKSGMNTGKAEPLGRKRYLHPLMDSSDSQGVLTLSKTGMKDSSGRYPWESFHVADTDSLKQKVQITPVKKGIIFTFTLDFDNCTEWELGMLLYMLLPSSQFCHKIGMGKPLGLGSCRIGINAVRFIDRKQRYGANTLAEYRYTHVEDKEKIDSFRTAFSESIEPDIRQAIELLGNPAKVRHPVHYPQIGGMDIEKEAFTWHTENQKNEGRTPGPQQLEPISKDPSQLPTLNR